MLEQVIIGTRGSKLALWQSRWVAERLREKHPAISVSLEVIKTSGDRFQEASLAVIGGKGAFTKEIQDALLERRVDLAVHSLKDLPTHQVPGLRIWAYPERFDPRDAWIGRDGLRFLDLADEDVVATGALRRAAQLKHRFPKVRVQDLRGNVDTRLRKLREGDMAGIFLAMAGLSRLGLDEVVTETLDPAVFLPAPGQGALAIEGRDDAQTEELLTPLDDASTRARVSAERAFLATLEGGCQIPIASLATLSGDDLVLDGLVADIDGSRMLRETARGSVAAPEDLGKLLAQELLSRGADEILAKVRR